MSFNTITVEFETGEDGDVESWKFGACETTASGAAVGDVLVRAAMRSCITGWKAVCEKNGESASIAGIARRAADDVIAIVLSTMLGNIGGDLEDHGVAALADCDCLFCASLRKIATRP